MRRLPNFHLLRAFEAAARLQSFGSAARELSVTPSAVSHQVKELETNLGCALFARSHRKVELTADGRRFYERLSPLLEALEEVCESVSHHPKQHNLSLYSAPSFAVKWLGPRLPQFVAAHPEVTLRLTTGAEPIDLLNHNDVDIAIFYGQGTNQPGIVTEALGNERIAPLCAPRMAKNIRDLETDLAPLTLIESPLSPVKWLDWCQWNGVHLRPTTRLSMDRAALAIAAAVDGLGVALESTMLAEKEIEHGELVELKFEKKKPIERTVHFLCYREADRSREPIKRFRDWLAGQRTQER